MLKLELDDLLNWVYLGNRAQVTLVTDRHEGTYSVRSSIRCPAGVQEVWVWLDPFGPLPKDHPPADEVRAAFAARFNKPPTLQG